MHFIFQFGTTQKTNKNTCEIYINSYVGAGEFVYYNKPETETKITFQKVVKAQKKKE